MSEPLAEQEPGRSKVEDCGDFYFFDCPHCYVGITVLKNQLNCKIFRCGEYRVDGPGYKEGDPIPPHLPKVECDRLVAENLIKGCGKPFIFKGEYVEKCEYI
jgi:hypothetical protein